MTSNSKTPALKKLILILASNYGVDMGDEQLMAWVAVLSDVELEACKKIMLDIMCDSSITKLPLPAQVREWTLAGEVHPADRDIGNEVAGRIWDAIGKFGIYQESGARQFIGELGWEAVQRLGGWNSICQIQNEERGIFFAQTRDQVEVLQRMARKGQLGQPRDIPKQVGRTVQQLIGRSMKGMPPDG